MQEANNIAIVTEIMSRLSEGGFSCALFGGWAEEAFGLCQPRSHADIDLLLEARSFQTLDHLLAVASDMEEIPLKRFAHKRAFVFKGIMIEVILVQQESGAAFTWFWNDVRFDWSAPLTECCVLGGHQLPAVSRHNLQNNRARHKLTEPWRWRNQNSLVFPTE